MLLKTKIMLGFVAASVLVGAGLWCGLKIRELDQVNTQLNEQLMQAKLEIGKAHTIFADNEELKKKNALLDKALRDEIKARKELITQYGELLAKYNAIGGGVMDSQGEAVIITSPTAIFKPGQIYVAQTETTAQVFTPPVPFNFADDRLSITTSLSTRPKDNRTHNLVADFKYDLHLKIMAQLVQTITESGAINNYANIFEIDKDGNKIGKFELSSFEMTVEDKRKTKFHLWNPKLDVGVIAGFDGGLMYGGDVGISLSSFGLSKNDLIWRFARFSVGFTNKGVSILLSPALWNVGDPLPLVQNLWIGANVLFNPNTRMFGFGAVLSVSM